MDDGWIDDGGVDYRWMMEGWMDGWMMEGWMRGRLDRWRGRWMNDGWMNDDGWRGE